MLALFRLSLLLAAFTTLVSSTPTPSLHGRGVYNGCSGKSHHAPPDNKKSIDLVKPQIHVDPRDVLKNGTGWEEWLWIGHNLLSNGTVVDYGYKWARGDPTSGNLSHTLFIAWAYFPNGTFYRQIERDVFKYEEHSDGGFTYSIANNNLTWDPKEETWNAAIHANGYEIESVTKDAEPAIPFIPSHGSKTGQIHKDFFSTVDVTRGDTKGKMTFPDGLSYPIKSVGSLKHTWSYEVMADTLSAYVRGSTFLPAVHPHPAYTVTWFQAWDPSGKETHSMQLTAEPEFKLQVTDTSKDITIVTTPAPAPPPSTYTSTEITFPMCGSKYDSKDHEKKITWKVNDAQKLFDFVDFANSVTLYRRVNITAVLWADGKKVELSGGVGLAEVYHR